MKKQTERKREEKDAVSHSGADYQQLTEHHFKGEEIKLALVSHIRLRGHGVHLRCLLLQVLGGRREGTARCQGIALQAAATTAVVQVQVLHAQGGGLVQEDVAGRGEGSE